MKHIAEFLKQVNNENAFKHKLRAYTTEKVSVFGVILVRIFPSFFRIRAEYLSIFSPNTEKCGKNADQNDFEYGHFLRSARYPVTCKMTFFMKIVNTSNKYAHIKKYRNFI